MLSHKHTLVQKTTQPWTNKHHPHPKLYDETKSETTGPRNLERSGVQDISKHKTTNDIPHYSNHHTRKEFWFNESTFIKSAWFFEYHIHTT